MKDDIYTKIKTLQKLEQEVITLEGLDRIKRKGHGQNFVIRRIKELVDDLNLLILGECKYGKANFCLIEKIECNVVDKESCAIRLKKDTEQLEKKDTNVFADVTEYKKLKGDKNE